MSSDISRRTAVLATALVGVSAFGQTAGSPGQRVQPPGEGFGPLGEVGPHVAPVSLRTALGLEVGE